jgi:hypothetical protein
MQVLDVLEQAERTLRRGPFVFQNWNACLCGHLFNAANGTFPEVLTPKTPTYEALRPLITRDVDKTPLYAAALEAIIRANELTGVSICGEDPRVHAVSGGVYDRSHESNMGYRDVSFEFLREAIRAEKERTATPFGGLPDDEVILGIMEETVAV